VGLTAGARALAVVRAVGQSRLRSNLRRLEMKFRALELMFQDRAFLNEEAVAELKRYRSQIDEIGKGIDDIFKRYGV